MRSIRIGSVFDIPIRLDVTFLLVLPVFAWLISGDVASLAGVFNDLLGTDLPAGTLATDDVRFPLGAVAAIGLFTGVLLHELGHAVIAIRYGYEIESITLWLFGGVARLVAMPEDWRHELAIAVAGPVVSVLIGVTSLVALQGVGAVDALGALDSPGAQFVLGYLALANLSLAVFNMLPGFPMDGGRVLRALLARNRPYAKATWQAAEVGKAFAVLLGLVGLFANLFLIALALFIYMAASSEAQQTAMRAAFEDVTVGDIMTPRDRLQVVEPGASVTELFDRMLRERHTGYPVLRDDALVGMVTIDDAKGVRDVERDAYTVGDVMSGDPVSVHPDDDVMHAVEVMREHGVGRLPVRADGRLVGLVSRTDVMNAFDVVGASGGLPDLGSRGRGQHRSAR